MRYFFFIAVVLALFSVTPAHAQGVEENMRYDSFMMDGSLHRFDRRTGNLQKLLRHQNGAYQWIPVEVNVSGQAPAAPAPAPDLRIPAPSQVQDNADLNRQPDPKRVRRAPTIEDEDGNVISDTINGDDRKAALPLIASYENKISLSHTVQIGDRITGNILIKNMGDRRIKALELTMMVPIIGRDKPEEHHFVFLDKPGNTTPPQPGSNGREPSALLQKVDIPCPSGGVKGSPELKISFIRFE